MKNLFVYFLPLLFIACNNGEKKSLTAAGEKPVVEFSELNQEQFRIRNIKLEGELETVQDFLYDDLTIMEIDFLSNKKSIFVSLRSSEKGQRLPTQWIFNDEIIPDTLQTLRLMIWANTTLLDEENARVDFKAESFFKNAPEMKMSNQKSFLISRKEVIGSCMNSLKGSHLFSTTDQIALWALGRGRGSADCKLGKLGTNSVVSDSLSLRVNIAFVD